MQRWTASMAATTAALAAAVVALDPPWRGWVGGGVGGLCIALFALGVAAPRMQWFARWWPHGPRDRPEVALTFDDGPDPDATAALLDLLARRGVRVTFFCIGRRVDQRPDLARRILAEGHDLGNHSHHHRWWHNFLFERRLRHELAHAQRALRRATGRRPTMYRPPWGMTNAHTHAAARRLGLRIIGWDIRTFDGYRSPAAVVAHVARRLRPGSVILLHDGGAQPQALCDMVSRILDLAAARGLQCVSVSQMLDGAVPPHRASGRQDRPTWPCDT